MKAEKGNTRKENTQLRIINFMELAQEEREANENRD